MAVADDIRRRFLPADEEAVAVAADQGIAARARNDLGWSVGGAAVAGIEQIRAGASLDQVDAVTAEDRGVAVAREDNI